ncbi:NAD-dependent succinate-semialdehyde dehydrogenase [Leuconostoc carnosum]|uniref:NAD-dependent succinate-semialdehyde dehydrogenase n=1 Tax=Leuconostoc TaxID=1243 RepID=UPI000D523FAE|nr:MULTISPECIES: NAD-dependent succinate-semialdehyde dehydrogenase [Leuconostoc]KAA8325337.1 NAD-dependent succinate-semialdehyde dehydrogenase [Leuconostoc carnosum]KAA8359559.1 NAD-dependent succinate-semialdehyde dehydrogenase [Leuconostoc carnosum]KAA8365134.1 NAD-dependent succinate-semialdehyde dehydrogenase [Leuconostoc carnosum]KAA8367503.1 NAD-dependent succinate-semialdehyde dehydrogenase [Leuconostoc carnosum]KAA8372697.1 NAD-dependent succinate-semialdehyde dehydrogenase [Leuconos
MSYQTVNPFTDEVIKTYDNHDDAYVEEAIANGDALYKQWRNDPIASRADALNKLADVMSSKADELAKILTKEMGKRFVEAQGEVALSVSIARYYAKNGADFLKPRDIQSSIGPAQIISRPTGVLLMVEPWNFPYYQIMRVFAPNYMAGNPMLLKHASNTPMAADAFEKIVQEAGLPDGVFTNLFINYDQVNHIIADKRVQGVALTGSERAGQLVAAEAGKNMKQSSLELGGSDPFVVLDDADLSEIQKIIGGARLYNAGQVCTSSKRFIVTEKNYDKIVEMLKTAFASAKLGDPMDPETTLAPLSTSKAKKNLTKQVRDAVEAGATLTFGSVEQNQPAALFEPVILTNITKDNPAYYQEFFGPVGQVYKVKDEAEAIALANDSNYGLSGVLFGGSAEHASEVASKIETGVVFVNSFGGTLPELPFGGVKNSGYGRELGDLGINAFVNKQTIVTKHEPIDLNDAFGGFV